MMEQEHGNVLEPIATVVQDIRRAGQGYAELAKEFEETMRPFAEAMAQVRTQQLELGQQIQDALQEIVRPFHLIQEDILRIVAPFGKAFDFIAEQGRTLKLIEQLGFVPHAALWAHVSGLEAPDETEREKFSIELTAVIWPAMKPKLQLSCEQCLSDVRLEKIFHNALEAHEKDLYEAVVSTAMMAMERAVFLARRSGEKVKAFEWLKEMVGSLPVGALGGYGGFKTWDILVTKVFDRCWTDNQANGMSYPNRNASAHGIGSKVAGPIDSLNAILLAHFAIQAAAEVKAYRDDATQASA
jgi:hypothetical protein